MGRQGEPYTTVLVEGAPPFWWRVQPYAQRSSAAIPASSRKYRARPATSAAAASATVLIASFGHAAHRGVAIAVAVLGDVAAPVAHELGQQRGADEADEATTAGGYRLTCIAARIRVL